MAIIYPKNSSQTLITHSRISAKTIKHPPSAKTTPRIVPKKPTARTRLIKTIPRPQQCHSRYACLGKKVNWRSGPGSDHDMVWFYESPDWPVVVLKSAMLRFKTTLLIKKDTPLYSKNRKGSPPKALLKKGTIVRYIRHTDGKWIYVVEPEHRLYGWVLSDTIWPNPASL